MKFVVLSGGALVWAVGSCAAATHDVPPEYSAPQAASRDAGTEVRGPAEAHDDAGTSMNVDPGAGSDRGAIDAIDDGGTDEAGTGLVAEVGKNREVVLVPGNPSSSGPLRPEVIRRVFREGAKELRHCRLQRDPSKSTTGMIRFLVQPSGDVAGVVVNPSGGQPEYEQCIAAAFLKFKFPSFSGPAVIITYPFVFKTE